MISNIEITEYFLKKYIKVFIKNIYGDRMLNFISYFRCIIHVVRLFRLVKIVIKIKIKI